MLQWITSIKLNWFTPIHWVWKKEQVTKEIWMWYHTITMVIGLLLSAEDGPLWSYLGCMW